MGILHPDQEEYLLPKVCDLKGTKISTMAKNILSLASQFSYYLVWLFPSKNY